MAIDPTRNHLDRELQTITHFALYQKTLRLVCANGDCDHVRFLDTLPLWWLCQP